MKKAFKKSYVLILKIHRPRNRKHDWTRRVAMQQRIHGICLNVL
uniref:Uncharacterized protein n=1 Tax=Arundo donax TaxID=35708 RepID=A0A0A9BKJ9_ARUDO